MYKDKEKAKTASKERMRKMRQGVTSGVTSQEGVTRVPVVEGMTQGVTVPEFARVLAPWTINSIIAVLKSRANLNLPDDSSNRWKCAVSYREWELAGRPVSE